MRITRTGWFLAGLLTVSAGYNAHQYKELVRIDVARALEATIAVAMVVRDSGLGKQEEFTHMEVLDKGGLQERYPITIMSDKDYVVMTQPNEDRESRFDRLVMNRPFAKKVAQALVDAVGLP